MVQELISASVGFIKVNSSVESIHQPNFVVTMSLVNLLCSHTHFALMDRGKQKLCISLFSGVM